LAHNHYQNSNVNFSDKNKKGQKNPAFFVISDEFITS